MRFLRLILLLLMSACVSACRGEDGDSKERDMRKSDALSSFPPGPERAKAARNRVKPELEKTLAEKGISFGAPVFLRAFKEESILELWVKKGEVFELFRSWSIAGQSGKLGPKLAEGDNQVPEGCYYAGPASMNPSSRYHLSFNIGYPNAYDRAHGRTGSLIMIHGSNVSIGCLAMTDPAIEEIYTLCSAALENGQPFFRIHLFPFRMTADRMEREKGNEWFGFWENLKEIYDAFELTKKEPVVEVRERKYIISQ